MNPKRVSSVQWQRYNRLFLLEHILGHGLFRKLFGKKEDQLIEEIRQSFDNNLLDSEDPTFEEFFPGNEVKSWGRTDKVQVFRQASNEWPCSKKWDFDFFVDYFADKEISILNSEGLHEKGVQDFGVTTMKKYIKSLREGSKVYLKFSPIIHHDSNLKKDLDFNFLNRFSLPGSFGKKLFLFIGGEKTHTPIHNALSNTVFIQLRGKKTWTFWEPDERLFLGVRPERRAYFFSKLNIDLKSDPAFPLSKYARSFEITLEAGDVMWFPAFFWHFVENPEPSIGVAYKLAHMPSAFKNSGMLTMLSFLATKPTLIGSLLSSGFKDNERVFR